MIDLIRKEGRGRPHAGYDRLSRYIPNTKRRGRGGGRAHPHPDTAASANPGNIRGTWYNTKFLIYKAPINRHPFSEGGSDRRSTVIQRKPVDDQSQNILLREFLSNDSYTILPDTALCRLHQMFIYLTVCGHGITSTWYISRIRNQDGHWAKGRYNVKPTRTYKNRPWVLEEWHIPMSYENELLRGTIVNRTKYC